MTRSLLVVLAGFALSAAAVAGPLPEAAAHTELVSSSPAAGDRMPAPVGQVRLTFTGTISPQFANLTLSVDGDTPRRLDSQVDGRTVTAALPATALKAGEGTQQWEVAYRVVAEDGHPINDTLTFIVTPTPSPAPSQSATNPTPTPGGAPATAAPTLTGGQAAAPPGDSHLRRNTGWIVPAAVFALVGVAALAAAWAPRIVERRESLAGADRPATAAGTGAVTEPTTPQPPAEQTGAEQPPTGAAPGDEAQPVDEGSS